MWEPVLGTGPDRAERIQAVVKDSPLRRFGRADEVAALAVLLASDEVTYMTGTELTLDGGMLAGSVVPVKRA
jgi:NAD(P)-dependent dehydrogenase (short-subunit alcohol dehydrogenase family)